MSLKFSFTFTFGRGAGAARAGVGLGSSGFGVCVLSYAGLSGLLLGCVFSELEVALAYDFSFEVSFYFYAYSSSFFLSSAAVSGTKISFLCKSIKLSMFIELAVSTLSPSFYFTSYSEK